MPLPDGVAAAPAAPSLPTNAGWMLTGLPPAARHARLDLFHAPAYTVPLASPRPLVVTIHDVSYERHPEWYPYRRDPLRRAFYRRSARAADRVITDSTFSRAEIAAAYDIPPEPIDVVPLAAAPVFSPGPPLPLPPGVPRALPAARRRPAPAPQPRGGRPRDERLRRRHPDLRDVGLVLAGVDRREADEALTAPAMASAG